MRRVRLPVQRHEEAFHVPVEAAFSDLVRVDLDKRVVATLGPRRHRQGA